MKGLTAREIKDILDKLPDPYWHEEKYVRVDYLPKPSARMSESGNACNLKIKTFTFMKNRYFEWVLI